MASLSSRRTSRAGVDSMGLPWYARACAGRAVSRFSTAEPDGNDNSYGYLILRGALLPPVGLLLYIVCGERRSVLRVGRNDLWPAG